MRTFVILVLSLCTLAHSQIAFSAQAGLVLIAKGGAFATDATGSQRPLKRRSKIMEGDIVSTDADGMIQIRFIDKALLTLKANSKLNINAYQKAKEEGQSEQVVMNLITGGFRTITGTIGKGKKSAYKVKTPAASIGIRGTSYEVAQEAQGNYVMAVWDGGITVSNDRGSLNIGQDSDFIFVRVSANSEPKGLKESPTVFSKTITIPNSKPSSSKDKKASSQSDDASVSEKTGGQASEDEEPIAEDQSTYKDIENADEEMDADNNPFQITDTQNEEDAKDSKLEDDISEVEEAASKLIEEAPLANVELVTSTDERFSDWEYSYLLQRPKAALLIGSSQNTIDNGLMVQDFVAGTDPVFIMAGDQTGTDNNLTSFTLDSNQLQSVSENVGGSEFVSWGKWNGTLEIFDNPSDPNAATTEANHFYWLSAEAASLSTLRGTASFAGSSEYLGDIDGTSITNLNGQFDVDFNTGKIENGALNFGHAEQGWAVNFTGSVTGANAVMDNIQGNITGTNACTECINGNVQGIFARPGDHFVGGFSLQGGSAAAADGTSNTSQANGLFLLKGK